MVKKQLKKREWNEIDFDFWKEKFDDLTIEDHKYVYNLRWRKTRKKSWFNTESVNVFLDKIEKPIRIMEIGGGDGRLAANILKKREDIICWDNYEISGEALLGDRCKDQRYESFLLFKFPWELEMIKRHDVCIMSDVMEHFKVKQIKQIVDRLKFIKHWYVKIPYHNFKEWRGTHVLNIGWKGVDKIFKKYEADRFDKNTTFYSIK